MKSQLQDVQTILDKLRARLERSIGSAGLRVPDEVLGLIMEEFCSDPNKRFSGYLSFARKEIVLSHVCRRWRRIAVSTLVYGHTL